MLKKFILISSILISTSSLAQMAVAPGPVVTPVPAVVAAPGPAMVAAPPAAVPAIATPSEVAIPPSAGESIIPREDVNPPGVVTSGTTATATSMTAPPLPPCPPTNAYPVPAGYRLAGISPSPNCQAAVIPMDDPNPFTNET